MVLSWFKPVNRGINKKHDQYLNCTIFEPSSAMASESPNDLDSDLYVRSPCMSCDLNRCTYCKFTVTSVRLKSRVKLVLAGTELIKHFGVFRLCF